MANKYTKYLTILEDFGRGLTNPKGLVSNYQHATRLFIDDQFRLSPRTKFNYFVRIELDKDATRAKSFTTRHAEETGLLAKSAELPKFKFDSKTLNQYNRKKIIYSNYNYEPITINFHDDNQGIISALWAIYYGYYVRDRHLPTSAYDANQYRKSDTPSDAFRYGLDSDILSPLFKSITIYTMARRRFIGYTLVNPKIISWNQGNMDYAASTEPASSEMTVEYEGVIYSSGRITEGSPKGFATLHYDNTPSPLTVAGGGISNLLGEGGVLDGIEQVFGAVADGTAFGSGQSFLSTAIKAVNTYKNAKELSSDSIKREAINILTSPAGIESVANTISGVAGAIFPKNDTNNTPITGTQRTVNGYTGEIQL